MSPMLCLLTRRRQSLWPYPGSTKLNAAILDLSGFPQSRFRGLARSGDLHYAEKVVSGVSPPRPLPYVPVPLQISVSEGRRMFQKKGWAILTVATLLSLPLAACKDTKTLQENEQLKTQLADLQKQNGQTGNELEAITAERDALAKENQQLKAQLKSKSKHTSTRTSRHKRRRA
jgi:hypothetical protein